MNRVRHTLRAAILFASFGALVCFVAIAQSPPQAAGRADSARFVGAEVCQSCHEDQYKTFAQSAHAQTLKRQKVAEQGCEGCHGPGAAHVEAGDPDKIRRFAGARQEAVAGVCGTCHNTHLSENHSKAGLICLSCHSAHHYQQPKALLVADEKHLCEKCHAEPSSRPFHS